jgi:hypothetical protein
VIKNIPAAYTVTGADYGVILNCTGTTSYTLNLAPAASVGSGFNVWIWNNTTSYVRTITIDPNGTETISGNLTLILRLGEGTQIASDGTSWQTVAKKTMLLYTENCAGGVSVQATGQNAIALGQNSLASNSSAFAAMGGTASGDTSFAAVGTASGSYAFTFGGTSSSSYSTTLGFNSGGSGSQAVTGAGAMALGGSYASGADSFAAAIANNTSSYGATGSSSVAIGRLAKANGANSIAIGSTTLWNNTNSSGANSVAIGDGSLAQNTGSFAFGVASKSSQIGKYTYGYSAFAAEGDSQSGTIVLRAATTGSAVVMTSNGSAAASSNQLVAASNQVFAVTGTLIGKQSASANIAAYTISATVVNNAGTLTVPTATLTLIGTDSIGLTTSPTLTADATNLCMAVTSGAKTATNIRWVCTLQTSELIYA